MHLNEGCLFRVHLDADWLETDVIAIEFRLLTTPLPDTDAAPTEETPADSSSSPEKNPEKLKEVRGGRGGGEGRRPGESEGL